MRKSKYNFAEMLVGSSVEIDEKPAIVSAAASMWCKRENVKMAEGAYTFSTPHKFKVRKTETGKALVTRLS